MLAVGSKVVEINNAVLVIDRSGGVVQALSLKIKSCIYWLGRLVFGFGCVSLPAALVGPNI